MALFVSMGARGDTGADKVKQALHLSCDPPAFSPNGDRVKDQTFIQPTLDVPESVRKWAFVIKSHEGKVVKKTGGYDDLPALLVWDGQDMKGQVVKEGSYHVELTVWGRSSGKHSASADVTLSLTPPMVEVTVSTNAFSPGLGDQKDHVDFGTRVQGGVDVDHWELTVRRENGAPVKVWRSTGTVPSSFSWDGREERFGVVVPSGRYVAELAVWDVAGNMGKSPAVAFDVNSPSPKVLGASLKKITVEESPQGLVARLPEAEIFLEKDREITLKPGAWDTLNELIYLVQSYSDRSCSIEGFAGRSPSEVGNMGLSSARAWKICSVLVKSGVSAKRLEVHGRGSQPLVDGTRFEGVVVTLLKKQEGQ